MQRGSRLFCQHNISGNDNIFHSIGNTVHTQFHGFIPLINDTAIHQIDILTMCQNRNVGRRRNLHGFAIEIGVHHTLAILGDGRDTRLDHAGQIRQFLPCHPLSNASRLQHVHQPCLFGLIMDITDHFCAISHRLRIGHGNNGGISPMRCRARTCDNILLVCQSRVTQMYMQINQSRQYITPLRINHFILRSRLQVLSHLADAPFLNIKVQHLIGIRCRVQYMSVSDQ